MLAAGVGALNNNVDFAVDVADDPPNENDKAAGAGAADDEGCAVNENGFVEAAGGCCAGADIENGLAVLPVDVDGAPPNEKDEVD